MRPMMILADEPTGNLDSRNSRDVMDLLVRAARHYQQTILMITHNMTDALTNGDRLLIFNDGKITQDFSGEEKKKLKPADLLDFYEV